MRFDLGEPVELRSPLPFLELRVRNHGYQRSIRIVEKLGPDEVFEKPSFAADTLKAFEIRVEVQRRKWVAAVLVSGQHREEEPQRVGESRVRAFAFLEFQVVNRCLDHRPLQAALGDLLKRVKHHLLDSFGVLWGNPFQAGAED